MYLIVLNEYLYHRMALKLTTSAILEPVDLGTIAHKFSDPGPGSVPDRRALVTPVTFWRHPRQRSRFDAACEGCHCARNPQYPVSLGPRGFSLGWGMIGQPSSALSLASQAYINCLISW